MENIEIRMNYNIILWHFIDSVSQWDHFVSQHDYKYFSKNFDINMEVKSALDNYSKIRKKLDWSEESNLFEWAYNGFKKHEKYSPLLPYIKIIEQQKNNEGKLLSEILNERFDESKKVINEVAESYKRTDLTKIIYKMNDLFTDVSDYLPKQIKEIVAYLPISMHPKSTQGGANGDAIYTEIPLEADSNNIASILVHEYLHKAIRVRKYLIQLKDESSKIFYKQNIKSLYKGNLSDLFDEAIIYSIANVLIGKESIQDRLDGFKKRISEDNVRINEMIKLWILIERFVPTINRYLDDKLSKSDTFNELDNKFREFVRVEF